MAIKWWLLVAVVLYTLFSDLYSGFYRNLNCAEFASMGGKEGIKMGFKS